MPRYGFNGNKELVELPPPGALFVRTHNETNVVLQIYVFLGGVHEASDGWSADLLILVSGWHKDETDASPVVERLDVSTMTVSTDWFVPNDPPMHGDSFEVRRLL